MKDMLLYYLERYEVVRGGPFLQDIVEASCTVIDDYSFIECLKVVSFETCKLFYSSSF